MRPKERRNGGPKDLFGARLDQIVDMNHPLAKLAAVIDWGFLERSFGAMYTDRHPERPKNRYARFWRAAYLRMSDYELRPVAFRGELREHFAEIGVDSPA